MPLLKSPNAGTSINTQYNSDPSLNTSFVDDEEQVTNTKVTRRQKRKCMKSPIHGDIVNKVDSSEKCMSEIKEMFKTLQSQQTAKFFALDSAIQTVVQQNQDIQKSVDFMSKQYDELLQRMTVLEQENLHYKKYVQELENKLDYLEKFSRSTTLEMRNIPKQDNENRQTLLDISKKVGSLIQLEPNLQDAEIRDIYRTKTQTIVIDYMSTSRKEDFLKKIKEYNRTKKEKNERQLNTLNIFTNGVQKNIYVTEFLTSKARRLHYLARELHRSKKIVGCWTAFGKVYARKEEGKPAIRIEKEEDLHRLIK